LVASTPHASASWCGRPPDAPSTRRSRGSSCRHRSKREGPARVEAAACWGRTDLERRLLKMTHSFRAFTCGGNRGKQRARVRMVGLRNRSRRSAASTILPKYITATRRVRCSTMARSWLSDTQPRRGATLARRGDTPHGPLGTSRRTSIRLAGHNRGHCARNLSAGVATRRRRSRHCGISGCAAGD
jgi:hypothetical protein